MPPWKTGKEDEGLPTEFCGDRIGALPDTLLHEVLSLLPAEEAVRTSVLARRWRYLWKFSKGLRVRCLDMDEPVSVNALRKFVDPLLLLRGGSPLQTFELRIGDFSNADDEPRADLWFQHAIACKVQVLKLHVHAYSDMEPWLSLEDLPLVSQHLTRLQLHRVGCFTGFLNFSGCSALDCLEFESCDLSSATKINFESLKGLTITDSIFCENVRMQICAPNLIAIFLDNFYNKTPILESMPSLVDTFVRITMYCSDCCGKLRGCTSNVCL